MNAFDPNVVVEEPRWASVDPESIQRCLGLLDPALRDAYHLRVEEKLSLAAAGKALGIPAATVGTRVHRARLQLRKLLDKDLGSGLAEQ